MARRRSDNGPTAIAVVVLALAFVGPILIIGAWLYYEFANSQMGTHEDVAAEKERLNHIQDQLSQQLEALFREGDAAGLCRRADQLFDGRTSLGRSLNADIESTQAQQEECCAQLAVMYGTEAKAKGTRAAVLTLLIAFAGLYVRNPAMGLIFQSAISSGAAIAIGYFWYRANRSD